MNELFDRLCYCLSAMEAVHFLAQHLKNDFDKRSIGRMLFIRLDDFIKGSPQLKNQLRSQRLNVTTLENKIRHLETDYESHYARIRDHLTAHRDDLDFITRLDLWSDIDWVSVEILTQDAKEILQEFTTIAPHLGQYNILAECGNQSLVTALSSLPLDPPGISIEMDNLANSRPNTVSIIPCHDSQERGLQIVSCFDLAMRHIQILSTLAQMSCLEVARVLKASVVMDLINLIDDLFGLPGRQPRNKTFLQIAKESNFLGHDILNSAAQNLDKSGIDRLLDLRNKVCAHLDRVTPLQQLLAMLDGASYKDLHTNIAALWTVFSHACRADIRTSTYLTHRRTLQGATGIESTGLDKPFF